MASGDRERAAVVEYWRVAEMFSSPGIEVVNERQWVFRVEDHEPLPWETEHRLKEVELPTDKAWRHTVFLGCYDLERVVDVLTQVFGADPESYDSRSDGESALAAFVVAEDGTLLDGSAILSSCAWATGQLLRPGGAGSLKAFGEAQPAISDLLTSVLVPLAPDDDRPPTPIDVDRLRSALDNVATWLGVRGCLDVTEIRVQSKQVSRRNGNDAEVDDFLNSMILDDLTEVAAQISRGRYGRALGCYLSAEEPVNKIDLRSAPEVSLTGTCPQAVPLGRWPAKSTHSLALSQQFAVNQSLLDLQTDGGIFAVNGPPGTGKTTMLRELVAAIVVQRAERLAALRVPREAFVGKGRWKLGDRELWIHFWNPDLTGHEIVVASSNNGAVENVTAEIPGVNAIDERWVGAIDYFADLATALLNVDQPDASPDELRQAWAMVAGKLGKKTYRIWFANMVWFGRSRKQAGESTPQSLHDVLAEMAADGPPEPWAASVARFRTALKAAEHGREQRAAVYDALVAEISLTKERAQAEAAVQESAGRAASLKERAGQAAASQIHAEQDVHEQRAARVDHLRFRPNLAQALFNWRRMRAWHRQDDQLAAQVSSAEQEHRRLRDELAELEQAVSLAHGEVTASRARAEAVDRALDHATRTVKAARYAWGEAVPGTSWWEDVDERERATPWTDEQWNSERTDVFLAALRLHRDFLAHTARQMKHNLSAAADILRGTAPRDLDEATARAAWQSLFFVVPVVSTTFASFGRVFSHLSADALGWLFVDEAGQATPQNAVGALWRSRRAIIVGDPLQLEPVLTLPFRAQQSLRIEHGVDERWLPERCSVQTLADEQMQVGTWLPCADNETRWVGAPLRVHRRCDEPMFGVVNRVVYNHLMVFGTPPRDEPMFQDTGRPLPLSKWLDVPSRQSDGHWVPAEGELLDKALNYLHLHGHDMTTVMVLAPFRDVARRISPICGRYPGVRAGTVHTAQGKEADVVFLVLGGDPQRPGAREWAARKPNLMNVAVSRAKRRLYVIGDRHAWRRLRPYFSELADALPVRD